MRIWLFQAINQFIFNQRNQELRNPPNTILDSLLGIYLVEPVGRILIDKAGIPISIIWFGALFFNYLYLAVQHDRSRNPLEILPEFLASLNPFLVVVEIISKPLMITLMLYYRRKIPEQLRKLAENDQLQPLSKNGWTFRLYQLTSRFSFQVLLSVILPSIFALLSIAINAPAGIPRIYWVIMFISAYSLIGAFFQIVYIFLILNTYSLNVRLQVDHPDKCSGLLPFGMLAIYAYIYFFTWALTRAVIAIAGADRLDRAVGNITGFNILYIWLFFPLAFFIIFDRLVHRPHHALQSVKEQYLLTTNLHWMRFHQKLIGNLKAIAIEPLKDDVQRDNSTHLTDDIDILDDWKKLNFYVSQVHTWPIPKDVFRFIAIFANPLIPLLLPLLFEMISRLIR